MIELTGGGGGALLPLENVNYFKSLLVHYFILTGANPRGLAKHYGAKGKF